MRVERSWCGTGATTVYQGGHIGETGGHSYEPGLGHGVEAGVGGWG